MIFFQFLLTLFFITVIYFHIAKKNFGVAVMYGVQSFLIVVLLINSFLETKSIFFFFIIFLVLIVKIIMAPVFIIRMINRHNLKFLVSNYANLPLTLIIVAALTAIAHSSVFAPLVAIVPANQELLSLALSSFFISLFLIVNRKGALSQIVGVLSLENSIVAFAFFAGLEQAPALQIGIMFDIAVWVVIATVFISMIYKHFGSLDVTEMKKLKD